MYAALTDIPFVLEVMDSGGFEEGILAAVAGVSEHDGGGHTVTTLTVDQTGVKIEKRIHR